MVFNVGLSATLNLCFDLVFDEGDMSLSLMVISRVPLSPILYLYSQFFQAYYMALLEYSTVYSCGSSGGLSGPWVVSAFWAVLLSRPFCSWSDPGVSWPRFWPVWGFVPECCGVARPRSAFCVCRPVRVRPLPVSLNSTVPGTTSSTE